MFEKIYEENFKKDYEKVMKILEKSEQEKSSFGHEIVKLGFHQMKTDHIPPMDIKFTYLKEYNNKKILIIEIIENRGKTFMPRPDGIKVELIVKEGDKEISKKKFNWVERAGLWEFDD